MESLPLYPSQSTILLRYHHSGFVQAATAFWAGIVFAGAAVFLLGGAIVLVFLGTPALLILTWQLVVVASMTFGLIAALLLLSANTTRHATVKLIEAMRDDIKLQAGLGLAARVAEPGVRNRLYTGLSLHLCGVKSAQVTYMGTLRKEMWPFTLRPSVTCRRRLLR